MSAYVTFMQPPTPTLNTNNLVSRLTETSSPVYLISYTPLANSQPGRTVAAKHHIAPYVDASCRREPDLEADLPFISGLCRPPFIAKLKQGDVLVYVTNKRSIHPEGRRLTAILQVDRRFSSHTEAAAWYQANNQPIPRNCVVPGNDPLPIHLTDPGMKLETSKFTDSRVWDRAIYVPRAKACKGCFSSQVLFRDLQDAPIVKDDFWHQWLGGDPGARIQAFGLLLQTSIRVALLNHIGINTASEQRAAKSAAS